MRRLRWKLGGCASGGGVFIGASYGKVGEGGCPGEKPGVEMRHGTALAGLSGEERRGKVGELLATYIERDRAKKKTAVFLFLSVSGD